jgi:hypothetical protein
MSELSIDVERVVREVLAELGTAPAANGGKNSVPPGSGATAGLSSSAVNTVGQANRGALQSTTDKSTTDRALAPPSSVPLASGENGNLVVDARVVTMNEILGRLAAVRRVVVSRGAIVTPAVRDELIRRGIPLEYRDSTAGRPTPLRLVVIVMGTDFDPASLAAGLARDGLTVEHTASDCLISSADQLARELAAPDTLGVLLSRHAAAGLCLANRLPGVRAITGVDAPTVAASAAAVGANLLVADPQAGTFFQLKQMIAEFCRGGVRPCPAHFRARLA